MKNSMQRNFNIPGVNLPGTKFRGANSDVHPYLKRDFWANPVNHFWENEMYSEESKEYFRDWLRTTTF